MFNPMKDTLVALLFALLLWPLGASAEGIPPIASANGKYENLVQVITCPEDRGQYGQFTDYGYWGGGSWCGHTGEAGYWVWVAPKWYVWGGKAQQNETPPAASVYGKYSGLRQVLKCPRDRKQYGDTHDYGYWGGGAWCGQTGKEGYWVWVHPNWYVWKNAN